MIFLTVISYVRLYRVKHSDVLVLGSLSQLLCPIQMSGKALIYMCGCFYFSPLAEKSLLVEALIGMCDCGFSFLFFYEWEFWIPLLGFHKSTPM